MTELEILVRQAIAAHRPESRDAAMLNLALHIHRLDGERKRYKDQIEQARQMGDANLEVDGNPEISVAEDAVWVSGWIRVPVTEDPPA